MASSSSSSTSTHRNSTSSSTHKSSTEIPHHVQSNSPAATHQITNIPHPTSPIFTFTPGPVHTHTPVPNPTRAPIKSSAAPSQSGQKPISIVFEVLGGLFASAFILGFIRCYHNYRKTPGRDRIADILQRHQLQRELEELERNPVLLPRHQSLREPAPPYFPRPPSYDNSNQRTSMPPVTLGRGEDHPQPDNRSQYSAVSTHSPPSSPPMSERVPLPSPAATPRVHPELS